MLEAEQVSIPYCSHYRLFSYDVPSLHNSDNNNSTICCWPNEDIMVEVSKREKEAGIIPDPDVDTYMKVPFASPVFFSFMWCSHMYFCSMAEFLFSIRIIRGSQLILLHEKSTSKVNLLILVFNNKLGNKAHKTT